MIVEGGTLRKLSETISYIERRITMSDGKTIKVRFGTYMVNGGDGSVWIKFFPSKEDAETYAQKEVEEIGYDERSENDVEAHELEFDLDGNFIKVIR